MNPDGTEIIDKLIDCAEFIQHQNRDMYAEYVSTQFAGIPTGATISGSSVSVDITPVLIPALTIIDALVRRCAELEGVTPDEYYEQLRAAQQQD